MDWNFGLTMTIMGMGVTIITLYLLTLVISLMIRLFPYKAADKAKGKD